MINLGFGWMVSAGCVWPGLDFHDRLLFTTLGPFVTLAYLGTTYALALFKTRQQPMQSSPTQISRADARERVERENLSALLLLTFLVYSPSSSNVFRMFACERLDDDEVYLRADYWILCLDNKHRVLQLYAGIMVVLVYPVGIPLMYAILLRRVRGILRPDGPARSNSPSASTLHTLWSPYRRGCYSYEASLFLFTACIICPSWRLTRLRHGSF